MNFISTIVKCLAHLIFTAAGLTCRHRTLGWLNFLLHESSVEVIKEQLRLHHLFPSRHHLPSFIHSFLRNFIHSLTRLPLCLA